MTVAHYDGHTYDFGKTPKEDLGEVVKNIEREKPLKPTSIFIPTTVSDAVDLKSLETDNPRLTPSANNILITLSKQKYPHELIIGIDRAEKPVFDIINKLLPEFPYRVVTIWDDDPRILQWQKELKEEHNYPILGGKGLNMWKAMGFAFMEEDRYKDAKPPVFVAHDMDIHKSVYDETFVPFLVHPIIHPEIPMNYTKAYYERVTEKKGACFFTARLRRGLFASFLLALRYSLIGNNLNVRDLRDYAASFKYPTSGEYAFDPNLIGEMLIPSDWALETGIILNMFNKEKKIGQVDLERYRHKRTPLSPGNINDGINKMGIEVLKFFFRKIDAIGCKDLSSKSVYENLKSNFKYFTEEMLKATLYVTKNRPRFDFDPEERVARDMFLECFDIAYKTYKADPAELSQLQNWENVPVAYRNRWMEIIEDQNPLLKKILK